MTAKVKFSTGEEATIQQYKWTAKDESFTRLLNSLLDPDGPSGSDPNPDLTAAREIAKLLDGEVVSFQEMFVEPGLIY